MLTHEREAMNLIQVASMTEDQARDYLESLRWPNGPVCPHCESQECTRLNGKKHRAGTIQCNSCREQFTVTVKSVLESSKIKLVKWVLAFHLLCSSKKGFSAKQLQRELSLGSYRTAWFMLHRVRHALESGFDAPLTGTVEMDETYVGARRPRVSNGIRGRGTAKTPVVALVQRDGDVRARPIENVTSETLRAEAKQHVDPAAILVTDQYASYTAVGREFSRHEVIKHSDKRYVVLAEDGFVVHTNTAECFFSLVKRGHFGVYHLWSKQHLPRYCHEFAFRWRHRKATDAQRREAALRQIGGKRLKYR
jgi:transposase-like protein